LATATLPLSSHKICIVTAEFLVSEPSGGIGTYCRSLVELLLAGGATVDVLYTRHSLTAPDACEREVAEWEGKGVSFHRPVQPDRTVDQQEASYLALNHLKEGKFDLAVFSDSNGGGYYPILARTSGCAELSDTVMCVVAHGATEWAADLNEAPLSSLQGLLVADMERMSVERADVIISPSQHMVDVYRGYGWDLPETVLILPNLNIFDPAPVRRQGYQPLNIAFFGRLETRKGLWMFCAALDRLRPFLVGRRVAFVGPDSIEAGQSAVTTIIRRAASWPFEIDIVTSLGTSEALDFLQRGRYLPVIPSLEDNSPSVILECLGRAMPFIASSGGGSTELVEPNSKNFFMPTAKALAQALEKFVAKGALPATPSFDPDTAKAAYLSAVKDMLTRNRKAVADVTPSDSDQGAMVILVGKDTTSRLLSIAAAKLISDLPANARRILLCHDPIEVRKQLGHLSLQEIEFHDLRSPEPLFQDLANASGVPVAICHPSLIVDGEWFIRTSEVFRRSADTGMVVGMLAGDEETPKLHEAKAGSLEERPRLPLKLLAELRRPLSEMSADSNSGFALVRSDLLPLLKGVQLLSDSGHPKGMVHLLTEVAAVLSDLGFGSRLIPDILVKSRLSERGSEVFDLGNYLRSRSRAKFEQMPGSDGSLLSRLAIDTSLRDARIAAHRQCLAEVAGVLGRAGYREALGVGSVEELVKLATATGHPEAAAELLVGNLTKDLVEPGDIRSFVRARASEIRLIDRATTGTGVRYINLTKPWSLKIVQHERRLELHPNLPEEGRAGIEFASIDLATRDQFRCEIGMPSMAAKAIRFRVDIIADRGKASYREEKVLEPGVEIDWRFPIPVELRKSARVLFTVESADPAEEPGESLTLWTDPLFVQSETGAQ
jgi:glycosyltransferase involved in cell wall biosynthesis